MAERADSTRADARTESNPPRPDEKLMLLAEFYVAAEDAVDRATEAQGQAEDRGVGVEAAQAEWRRACAEAKRLRASLITTSAETLDGALVKAGALWRVFKSTRTPEEELAYLIESGDTDAETLAGLSVIADLMSLERREDVRTSDNAEIQKKIDKRIDEECRQKIDAMNSLYAEWLRLRGMQQTTKEEDELGAVMDRLRDVEFAFMRAPSPISWMIWRKFEVLEDCLQTIATEGPWTDHRELVYLAALRADLTQLGVG